MGILLKMSHDFTKAFGLTNEQIEGPYEKITTRAKVAAIFSKVGALLTTKGILKIVTSQATETAVEEFVRYIPLIGQLAAGALSFGATYIAGRILLRSMRNLAMEMAEEVIQFQSEKEDFSLNQNEVQEYQKYEDQQLEKRQQNQDSSERALYFGGSPRQVQQQQQVSPRQQQNLSPTQIQQTQQQNSSPTQVQQTQQQNSSPRQVQQTQQVSPKQVQQPQQQNSSPRPQQNSSPRPQQLYPSPRNSIQNHTQRYEQYA